MAGSCATSLGAPAITRISRGLPNATLVAAIVFVIGLLGVIQGSFVALVIGVVLLCGSMVFQQATQIVLLNDYFARSQSGTVSALFVAAVFAGERGVAFQGQGRVVQGGLQAVLGDRVAATEIVQGDGAITVFLPAQAAALTVARWEARAVAFTQVGCLSGGAGRTGLGPGRSMW